MLLEYSLSIRNGFFKPQEGNVYFDVSSNFLGHLSADNDPD